MTAPSQNKVVHCLNSGGVTWCGIPGPWQEERRPIEQVREFQIDTERNRDSSLGERGGFGGLAESPKRREVLVGRRVSWYAYQDQVAASHWSLVTCPRCLDEHQRVLEEQKRERQRNDWKWALIFVAVFAVGVVIIIVRALSV